MQLLQREEGVAYFGGKIYCHPIHRTASKNWPFGQTNQQTNKQTKKTSRQFDKQTHNQKTDNQPILYSKFKDAAHLTAKEQTKRGRKTKSRKKTD